MSKISNTRKTGKISPPPAGYDVLASELNGIIADLQREDVDVDEVLVGYARGLELIQQLESYLTAAENTVSELKAKFNTSLQ